MKILLSVLALSAALSVGVAEARTVEVSTRGVNFSDAASVDTFHRSLAQAAADACRTPVRRGLAGLKEKRACRALALSNAVDGMRQPLLSALNDGLDARLRLNPKRPALDGTALAALQNAAPSQRADIPAAVVSR
jgi:UrcA family protein